MKNIIRISLAVIIGIAVLAFLVGCGVRVPGAVTGSGKAETREFNLSGFSEIQAANAFSIQVSSSESFKVRVTADDNLWNSLDISVSGNTLHLRPKPGIGIIGGTLKADVTMPSVKSLDLSGASSATLSGFNSNDNVNFTLSGAAKVNLDNMKSGPSIFELSGASNASGSFTTSNVKLTTSGGSNVNLEGSATDITIDASGASHIILKQFKANKASVVLSGGSEARVNVQSINSADLSGASNLYYTGNPTIGNLQTSGASGIHHE
jgi:hypothetical protein